MSLTPCIENFCGRVADPKGRGRCRVHATERNRATHQTGRLRPDAGRIYDTKRWGITRRAQLDREPLCRDCGKVASDADHVIPLEDGGEAWSFENLASRCRSCHSARHAKGRS